MPNFSYFYLFVQLVFVIFLPLDQNFFSQKLLSFILESHFIVVKIVKINKIEYHKLEAVFLC